MIVLQPGTPANPLAGIASKPGLYIRFKNGIADVEDQEIIDKLLKHESLNGDFVCVEENAKDPYENVREDMEPPHVITEIKYGHAEGRKGSPRKIKLTPELSKMVNQLAMEKVKEILPDLVKATIQDMAKASKEASKKDKEVE